MTPARQRWIASHPWLGPIARFQEAVDEAAAGEAPRPVAVPSLDAYAGDQANGVPLLRSRSAAPDFAGAAAEALGALAERLGAVAPPGRVGEACRDLRGELRRPQARRAAVEWIADDAAAPGSSHPGLLRFLGWTAARRVLEPVVARTASWHDPVRWGRGSCPTCGALPLSAQLVSEDQARPRLLSCGCCGTRWRYRRLGCPFCGNESQGTLGILQVEGEESLRVDVCDACGAYLKTYTGEGDEALFLADWPTLHLDLIAVGRGYQRLGASLYELPTDERRSEP